MHHLYCHDGPLLRSFLPSQHQIIHRIDHQSNLAITFRSPVHGHPTNHPPCHGTQNHHRHHYNYDFIMPREQPHVPTPWADAGARREREARARQAAAFPSTSATPRAARFTEHFAADPWQPSAAAAATAASVPPGARAPKSMTKRSSTSSRRSPPGREREPRESLLARLWQFIKRWFLGAGNKQVKAGKGADIVGDMKRREKERAGLL